MALRILVSVLFHILLFGSVTYAKNLSSNNSLDWHPPLEDGKTTFTFHQTISSEKCGPGKEIFFQSGAILCKRPDGGKYCSLNLNSKSELKAGLSCELVWTRPEVELMRLPGGADAVGLVLELLELTSHSQHGKPVATSIFLNFRKPQNCPPIQCQKTPDHYLGKVMGGNSNGNLSSEDLRQVFGKKIRLSKSHETTGTRLQSGKNNTVDRRNTKTDLPHQQRRSVNPAKTTRQ